MFLVEPLSNARIPDYATLERMRLADKAGVKYTGKIVYGALVGDPPKFDLHLEYSRCAYKR